MKKKLVLILATMMCLSLCACGGMGNKDEQNNKGQLEIKGIKPGKYTVQQKTPPESYILNLP